MNNSYLPSDKEKLKDLFNQSHPEIKALIKGGETKEVVTKLSDIYKIPAGKTIPLSNIIIYVLIGALQPDDVVRAIMDLVEVDEKTANLIAADLNKGIFQHARQIMLGDKDEVVKLEFKGEKTPEELRKELMDTTKQQSGITTPQSSGEAPKKTTALPSGSRSALMEQLQILGNIPNDREIEDRLKTIQKQVAEIKKKEEEDNTLHSPVALKSFMFGEKGKELVAPKARPATYSVAPTQYNIDPYREVTEE
jgi:hypothetical protein